MSKHMILCLGHVQDDTGEGRAGTRAPHSEVAGGARRREAFRFSQEGIGTSGGAPYDAGVVGACTTGKAHPSQEKLCASHTRTARVTMIVWACSSPADAGPDRTPGTGLSPERGLGSHVASSRSPDGPSTPRNI